jgi:hypothetical protein
MFYLLYASTSVKPFSDSDLTNLLTESRENNSRLDITGMLLYKEGSFLQVLEGDQVEVKGLYMKITRDPRHYFPSLIFEGFNDDRQFPDWSMGFQNINSIDPQTPGYSDFFQHNFTSPHFTQNPGICQRSLLMFKKYM